MPTLLDQLIVFCEPVLVNILSLIYVLDAKNPLVTDLQSRFNPGKVRFNEMLELPRLQEIALQVDSILSQRTNGNQNIQAFKSAHAFKQSFVSIIDAVSDVIYQKKPFLDPNLSMQALIKKMKDMHDKVNDPDICHRTVKYIHVVETLHHYSSTASFIGSLFIPKLYIQPRLVNFYKKKYMPARYERDYEFYLDGNHENLSEIINQLENEKRQLTGGPAGNRDRVVHTIVQSREVTANLISEQISFFRDYPVFNITIILLVCIGGILFGFTLSKSKFTPPTITNEFSLIGLGIFATILSEGWHHYRNRQNHKTHTQKLQDKQEILMDLCQDIILVQRPELSQSYFICQAQQYKNVLAKDVRMMLRDLLTKYKIRLKANKYINEVFVFADHPLDKTTVQNVKARFVKILDRLDEINQNYEKVFEQINVIAALVHSKPTTRSQNYLLNRDKDDLPINLFRIVFQDKFLESLSKFDFKEFDGWDIKLQNNNVLVIEAVYPLPNFAKMWKTLQERVGHIKFETASTPAILLNRLNPRKIENKSDNTANTDDKIAPVIKFVKRTPEIKLDAGVKTINADGNPHPAGTEILLETLPTILTAKVILSECKIGDREESFQAGLEKGMNKQGPGIEKLGKVSGYTLIRLSAITGTWDGCFGFIEEYEYENERRRRCVFLTYDPKRHEFGSLNDLYETLKVPIKKYEETQKTQTQILASPPTSGTGMRVSASI